MGGREEVPRRLAAEVEACSEGVGRQHQVEEVSASVTGLDLLFRSAFHRSRYPCQRFVRTGHSSFFPATSRATLWPPTDRSWQVAGALPSAGVAPALAAGRLRSSWSTFTWREPAGHCSSGDAHVW